MPKEYTDKIKAQGEQKQREKKVESDKVHNLPKEFGQDQGMCKSVSIGNIEMFEGSSLVMTWQSLSDPQGIRNLILHQMRR